jgi:hypothetical protein
MQIRKKGRTSARLSGPLEEVWRGKKVIEASQKYILTVVFTLEEGERYSRWHHC